MVELEMDVADMRLKIAATDHERIKWILGAPKIGVMGQNNE